MHRPVEHMVPDTSKEFKPGDWPADDDQARLHDAGLAGLDMQQALSSMPVALCHPSYLSILRRMLRKLHCAVLGRTQPAGKVALPVRLQLIPS